MPYAYGMQNAPVVGNGLGGLPRRATAAAATAAVAEKNYTFTSVATAYGNTQNTSSGAFFYFDDNNIYWNPSYSTTYGCNKFTFNRATSTLSYAGENQASISGVGNELTNSYSIRASSTLIASPTGRKAVLSAGPTITLSQIVPNSGNVTVGGTAYNFVNNIMVRVIPDSTNVVVVGKVSNTSAAIFILDNTFTVIKSFIQRVDNNSGTIFDCSNCFMVDSKTLIITSFYGDTSSAKFCLTCIDIDTNAIVSSSGVFTQALRAAAATNYQGLGSIYDRQTGRIHMPCYVEYTTYNWINIPYYCTFNPTTRTFTHWNNTTGNQTGRGINIDYPKYYNNQDIREGLLGFWLGAYFNEYGNPYSQYGRFSSDGYILRLPFAPQSFTDPTDFTFLNITDALHPTGYVVGTPNVVNRGKYQIWWTGDPSYGWALGVATVPISIGDNLYIVVQQRSNADGWVYGKVFRRNES